MLTASTSSSISLRWNHAYEGSLSRTYWIRWSCITGNLTESGIAKGTSYGATNLKSNTAYEFTVTVRSEAGIGIASDKVIFETGIHNLC